MSKPAAAAKKAGAVGAAADASGAVKKVGAASGPLDKRLQVKSNTDDDDWSKWNIQELRSSMVEDRANLQVSRRVSRVSCIFSRDRPRQLCAKQTASSPNKARRLSSISAAS